MQNEIKRKINVLQVIRAIEPHIEKVKHIVFIFSSGKDGSAKDREQYKLLFQMLLPADVIINDQLEPVDFEDINELERCIIECCDNLVKQHRLDESDIVIDATGGNKTASIAAVMATLDRPNLEFQYVQTNEPYEVKAYNAMAVFPKQSAG